MRNLLFGVYVCLCLAALIWPGYDWLGNRIEPYVLGVPFSMVWVLGWVMGTFVVLVIYHATLPDDAPDELPDGLADGLPDDGRGESAVAAREEG